MTEVLSIEYTEILNVTMTEVLSIEYTEILNVTMTEVLSIEYTEILNVTMTEVLSIEYTEILNVTMTAHCRDCASRSDQHETQVNARSLHVRREPRANSGGKRKKAPTTLACKLAYSYRFITIQGIS